MSFPIVSVAEWKQQVERELKGTPFEKLIAKTPEGLAVQPLYTDAPVLPLPAPRGEGRGEGPSSLALHEAGADAADELSALLSQAVALLKAGKPPKAVEISIGRDTFAELCKLRALRICWNKLMTAAGKPGASLFVRAVCSKRTLTQRDPWVNMLRVTTQVFAGILGGADEIVPATFDAELSAQSELGKRVAENTRLILEHESSLGRVEDPAAGSYYLDTLTDQLAREAWKRFQALEGQGGFEKALPALEARIAKDWSTRLAALSTRKIPVLGVSEFANVDEVLPSAPRSFTGPGHRDAEAFERLRLIADRSKPAATLVTLGAFAESRARVGFATNFFGAGGFRTAESPLSTTVSPSGGEGGPIACLCGTDERYAVEAAAAAKQLKAAGFKTVLLAGKPSSVEGVDGYIFLGCDVIDTLSGLLEGAR